MCKIILLSVMKNEAELLPYWLRHYAPQVDKIIVWDHNSTDGTPDILKAHGVEIRQYEPERFDDGDFIEFLNQEREAIRHDCDWTIIADADEIIWRGNIGIRNTLDVSDVLGVTVPTIQGYSMIASRFPIGDGQLYDYCKGGVIDDTYSKPAIVSTKISVRYQPGRHNATFGPGAVCSQVPRFKLLHYKYFGRDWLARRSAKNMTYLSDRAPACGWGWQAQPGWIGRYSADWFEEQANHIVQVIP